MFEIVIRLPGHPETIGKLVPGTYRIGSSPAAHIQINLPEVSARLFLLTVKANGLTIQDAGSKNSTYVDDQKLGAEPMALASGAIIMIGDSTILVRDPNARGSGTANNNATLASDGALPPLAKTAVRHTRANSKGCIPMLAISGIPYEYRRVVQAAKREVHNKLISHMNLKNLTLLGAEYNQVQSEAGKVICTIVGERRNKIPSAVDICLLKREITDKAVAFCPLEGMLENPDITKIMVNGADYVFVEKDRTLHQTDYMFD
jgi:pilus assembly protein CpaF